jgi:hypothetical protein
MKHGTAFGKGKSPYATKGKSPFQYSDAYQQWSSEVARSGIASTATQEADTRFRRLFNVPLTKRSFDF